MSFQFIFWFRNIFSFSAAFIWPQLESNYWIYIHELKKLGNSFTSELLIRNGNKTLCFLKAKLAFINLFLCMLKLEPRKVPIFYYITVTSKSAILWTKEHFIIHYKPRCMLFRFVLLFLGPKSGTKRGLTVQLYFLLRSASERNLALLFKLHSYALAKQKQIAAAQFSFALAVTSSQRAAL